jgi:hypothetical protein
VIYTAKESKNPSPHHIREVGEAARGGGGRNGEWEKDVQF